MWTIFIFWKLIGRVEAFYPKSRVIKQTFYIGLVSFQVGILSSNLSSFSVISPTQIHHEFSLYNTNFSWLLLQKCIGIPEHILCVTKNLDKNNKIWKIYKQNTHSTSCPRPPFQYSKQFAWIDIYFSYKTLLLLFLIGTQYNPRASPKSPRSPASPSFYL